MHTSKCQNLIEARSLPVERVDSCSMKFHVALVNMHLLWSTLSEYGINDLLRVMLNGMQDFQHPPMTNDGEEAHIIRSAL